MPLGSGERQRRHSFPAVSPLLRLVALPFCPRGSDSPGSLSVCGSRRGGREAVACGLRQNSPWQTSRGGLKELRPSPRSHKVLFPPLQDSLRINEKSARCNLAMTRMNKVNVDWIFKNLQEGFGLSTKLPARKDKRCLGSLPVVHWKNL